MLLYQMTVDDEVGFTDEALTAALEEDGLLVLHQFDQHGHVNLVSSSLHDLGEAALILADNDARAALYSLEDAEVFVDEVHEDQLKKLTRERS